MNHYNCIFINRGIWIPAFARMTEHLNKKRPGFTMVETIMYVAFISITISLFVGFGSQMSDLRAKTAVIQEVEANGTTVINFLEDYLKAARQVVLPLPGESDIHAMELAIPESDNVIFTVIDGVLYLTLGATDPVQISGNAINIKDLSFENTAQNGQKDNVVINLDLEYRYHDSAAYVYNKQFHSTVTLR